MSESLDWSNHRLVRCFEAIRPRSILNKYSEDNDQQGFVCNLGDCFSKQKVDHVLVRGYIVRFKRCYCH